MTGAATGNEEAAAADEANIWSRRDPEAGSVDGGENASRMAGGGAGAVEGGRAEGNRAAKSASGAPVGSSNAGRGAGAEVVVVVEVVWDVRVTVCVVDVPGAGAGAGAGISDGPPREAKSWSRVFSGGAGPSLSAAPGTALPMNFSCCCWKDWSAAPDWLRSSSLSSASEWYCTWDRGVNGGEETCPSTVSRASRPSLSFALWKRGQKRFREDRKRAHRFIK